MSNGNTVAQWQQAKDALVAQSKDLYAQFATLKQQGTQLAFQSADLYKQIKATEDPVKRAQLQTQFDNVQAQLQQNNTKIDENQSQQETIGNQIETANNEINRASSGAPNTNTTTDPANNNPGSNTQASPLPDTPAPAVQYSVPPQLRIEASLIGPNQYTYDVIDTERGKIIQSFDTLEQANSYVAQQGSTPGAAPATTNNTVQNSAPATVSGPTGTPYDDEGNLNLGWGLDEENNPVWIGGAYNDATGQGAPVVSPQKTIPNNSVQGPPYDDEGNLMPGWTLDEENNPVYVGGDFVEPATKASADASRAAALGAKKAGAQSTATNQDALSFEKAKDWRVRLSLAPSANYLYKADNPGILKPLKATNGVIFPYTPNVSVVYSAAYDSSDLVHSNYKIYNYKNSNVDTVTITCDFTAQDTNEADYLLAVIHFFRSVTKMFYGRDENPRNGTPPPLCYMSGLGTFQFDNHPLAVTNFTYTLPTDVDYIRAGSQTNEPGNSTSQQRSPVNTDSASSARIMSSGLGAKTPNFQRQSASINSSATYVPTKMSISITCIPIVTRNAISNTFSLKDYATGKLLQGSKQNGGGIW